MPIQAAVTTTTRIGVESTPGTAVTANVQLGSLSLVPSWNIAAEGIRPDGYKGDTGAKVNTDMTTLRLGGTPTYNEASYVWSLITSTATPTQPANAVKTYDRVHRSSTTGADTLAALTLESGADATRAVATKNARLNALEFSWSRKNGCSWGGGGFAQRMEDDKVRYLKVVATGGTFTVTVGAATTSALAYNITASALKTAVEGLASVGAGNVDVIGGPGATSPLRLQFKGAFLNTALPTISTNGASLTGTTPSATFTRLYPSPVEYTQRPIQGKHLSIYLADTYAGLAGASAYTQSFRGALKISDRQGEIFFIDSTQDSWGDAAEGNPKEEVSLLVANDAAGMELLNKLRTASPQFMRVLAIGDVIETVSGPTTYYQTHRLDMCISWLSPGERTVEDRIVAYEFTGSLRHDPTWGYRYEVFTRSNVPALGSAEA